MTEKNKKYEIDFPEYKRKWYENFYYYLIWKLFDFFQTKYYNLKHRCERFIRGYSHYDASEIDAFFINTMLPMFKEFKKNTYFYPSTIKDGNTWLKILDDIIIGFEVAEETLDNYYMWDVDFEKLSEEDKEKYTNDEYFKLLPKKQYDRAFNLFHKYFGNFND